jgi:hypothetical protein
MRCVISDIGIYRRGAHGLANLLTQPLHPRDGDLLHASWSSMRSPRCNTLSIEARRRMRHASSNWSARAFLKVIEQMPCFFVCMLRIRSNSNSNHHILCKEVAYSPNAWHRFKKLKDLLATHCIISKFNESRPMLHWVAKLRFFKSRRHRPCQTLGLTCGRRRA